MQFDDQKIVSGSYDKKIKVLCNYFLEAVQQKFSSSFDVQRN